MCGAAATHGSSRMTPSSTARAIVRTVHTVGYAFNVDVAIDANAATEPRAVRAWLVGELLRIPLYAGENVLGRGGDGVTTVDDGTVSRRHARLVVEIEGVTIEDLDSTNGTWLGDQRLTGRTPVRAWRFPPATTWRCRD